MNTIKKIALPIMVLLMVAPLISLASAAVPGTAITASVWTTTADGTKTNHFDPGQEIRIQFNLYPDGSTANVKVVDTTGATVAGPWILVDETDLPLIIADGLGAGYYFVIVDGALPFQIASGTFNVVPESIFGTLAALGAGVAAFGTVAIVKRKRD